MIDRIVKNFEELVELNFQLYSNLFLTIPMDAVVRTGMLIPLLRDACEKGFDEAKDPLQIIDQFLDKNAPDLSEKEKIDFLFHVIQYIERQIVLVDALEDAAYNEIHRVDGPNTLNQFLMRIKEDRLEWKLRHFLDSFSVRVVLTAHPTQFYPGQVLAISTDLTGAIAAKETMKVRDLMHQLSKTPFFRKQKPTPLSEAVRLTWYLTNIFYPAAGDLLEVLSINYANELDNNKRLISFGFWPGGDRDGNPYVDVETTLKVASNLRTAIIDCYLDDLVKLKRRLTFDGIYQQLDTLHAALTEERAAEIAGSKLNLSDFQEQLLAVEQTIIARHNSLFVNLLQNFRRKVGLFGYHFASLDIRQDSRVIHKAFDDILHHNQGIDFPLSESSQMEMEISGLLNITGQITGFDYDDPLTSDTLQSLIVMRKIQEYNGEAGCNRYIISNCRGPQDVARVLALCRLTGWINPALDVVPLFETIDDLRNASASMRKLYTGQEYMDHLKRRGNRQTVMLGFSDGTKDGGYLTANWSIFTAKEEITKVSREYGVEVVFFDGRGGPPARGGGNAHMFYAALGSKIESREIQLTLQGQTISSHYGLKQSAAHNLGYLMTAGLSNNVYSQPDKDLSEEDRHLMEEMSAFAYNTYNALKNHGVFLSYLEERSTLKYYGQANITSRPSKRKEGDKLSLDDLRAIPFVGAWSQLKQNVPGFFGLGAALKDQEEKGNLQQCIELYKRSGFFRALISNSMQSISKSNFALTKYMKEDPEYGEFWQIIYDEFQLTREMLLKVSGMTVMLEDNPRSRMSIRLREKIVLPLLVIQQYALIKIHQKEETNMEAYEKLVMRSLFGNINASRNAV